jgi:hypothetical protein
LEAVQRRSAIGLSFHAVALSLEKPTKGFLNRRVVFDDQDAADRL